MSNKNRKIAGAVFLIILIAVGVMLTSNNHESIGWLLVLLGALGLFGILVGRIHSSLQKPAGRHKKPYWVYSITVFALWGVIFLAHWLANSPPHPKTLGLVFLGYFIGWLGATIARKLYK